MVEAKVVLSNTFFMYNKAHTYHWNIEGINFPQMHEFFGDLYQELFDALDPLAEHIRTLGEYAPKNVEEMYDLKTIDCKNVGVGCKTMVADLLAANNETIDSLNKLFKQLQLANKQGFINFVADRIDIHEKHGWMLKSILKETGE